MPSAAHTHSHPPTTHDNNLFRLASLLFLVLLATTNFSWAEYPSAKNEYVNDFAHLIDDDTKQELKEKLHEVEYYSGVEISVATINSYGSYHTGATSWEEFCTGLFNYWGVGNKKHNDGVLFLVSKEDRKIRIELGRGYPSHYDPIMKEIIDEHITPLLKTGNFASGIRVGTEKIIAATTTPVSFFEWYKWYILGGIGALMSLIIALVIDKKKNPGLFWVLLGLAGFLILGILRGLRDGEASVGFGGGDSGGGGASGDF